jgi:hypothetical protein
MWEDERTRPVFADEIKKCCYGGEFHLISWAMTFAELSGIPDCGIGMSILGKC